MAKILKSVKWSRDLSTRSVCLPQKRAGGVDLDSKYVEKAGGSYWLNPTRLPRWNLG